MSERDVRQHDRVSLRLLSRVGVSSILVSLKHGLSLNTKEPE